MQKPLGVTAHVKFGGLRLQYALRRVAIYIVHICILNVDAHG